MRNLAVRCSAVIAIALAIGACSKNPTISPAPPPPARMYVADLTNGLVAFSQPVTSTSTPLFTLPGSEDSGVVVDAQGDVFVSHYNVPNIDMYKQPISATSTPALTMNVAITNISGLSIDKSGNLWGASEFGNDVFEISPPFANGATVPTIFASTSFNGPATIVFDSAGNMLVPQYAGQGLLVFSPPFNPTPGTNVPSANIPLTDMPIVPNPGVPDNAAGCAIDLKNNLIIGLNNSGQLAALTPPFATGNTPAGWIASPTINAGLSGEPLHSIFDPFGNLWVPYGQHGGANAGVVEYIPPFSSASAPAVTLGAGASSGLAFPFGIAFGP